MSELSDALRQFADRLDQDPTLVGTMCALVVADDSGKTKTSYIGRLTPAEPATIILLARGIQQMVERAQAAGASPGNLASTASRSTH